MLKHAIDSSKQMTKAVVSDAPGMMIGKSDGSRKRVRVSLAFVLGLVLAGIGVSAQAETVAYWPLAYDNGVRTTTETAFANEGTAEGLTAYPLCMNGTSSGEEIIAGSATCPVGTNAFPSGYGVYDPVARANRPAATGLYFKTPGTSNTRGKVGALRVTNPAALRLTTFTVECFLRFQAETPRNMSWNCIAVMPRQLYNNGTKVVNCDSWGLRLLEPAKGTMHVRFAPVSYTFSNDSTTTGSTTIGATCTDIADGNWHPLAFSVDDATHAVKIYYDYVLVKTQNLKFSVTYSDAEDFYIGSTPQTPGPFGGSLAHFRVSNEVLTPESFLQFTRTEAAAGEDGDVLLHVNFEPVDGISANGVVFNEAAKGPAVRRVTSTNTVLTLLGETPAAAIRSTLISPNSVANSSCMTNIFDSTASKAYFSWTPPEDVFSNSSFTVECFYKTTGAEQYRPFVRRRGGSNVQFNLGFSATDKVSLSAIDAGEQKFANDPVVSNDGEWHHAAGVFDSASKVMHMFRDYRLVGAVSYSGTLVQEPSNPVCIAGVDGGGRSFGGCLDEVRITMRALTPGEFLTSEHFDPATKTLAWVSFDNTVDSSVSPYALYGGEVSADDGGEMPTYVAFGNGAARRIEDGAGAILRKGDYAALSFQTGVVKYVNNPLLPLFPDQTIEIFFKADPSVNEHNGGILRCNSRKDASIPTWGMSFEGSDILKLRCEFLTDAGTAVSMGANAINGPTGVTIADGKWHHIAMTLAETETNGKHYTTVSVHKDYSATPDWTKTCPGRLHYSGDGSIWLGASKAGILNGQVNELRISRGVLSPSEFMRIGTSGLAILFR